jgi:hypothetical protein
MKQDFELRLVRDFSELISDTFNFLKKTWQPLLKAYAIICGFFILAGLAVSYVQQSRVMNYMKTVQNAPGDYESITSIYGWEYFASLFFSLVTFTSVSLVAFSFIALYQKKDNEAPNVEEVWAYFKFYFFRVLGANLVLGVLLTLAAVFCLAPAIYLFPIFALILPIIIVENASFGYAFSHSFQLIKNNFWTSLGAIFVIGIISYACIMVFVLPVSIIAGIGFFTTGFKLNTMYVMAISILSHLCYVFLLIPNITIALNYFSLTEIKEGTGLMSRINSIGNSGNDDGLQFPAEQY